MSNAIMAFGFSVLGYFFLKGESDVWHAAQYLALLSIWYELHDFVNKDKEK